LGAYGEGSVMSDIVERIDEAIKRHIARHRKLTVDDLTDARAEITSLRAENERLRETLKPSDWEIP
jgi:phosphoserine phosphatase